MPTGAVMRDAIARLKALQRETQCLSHAAAVLEWDQETYMPAGAVQERADQLALIEGLVHERTAAAEVGELLTAFGASDERPSGGATLDEVDAALVRESWRAYRRATRLPRDLVKALARQASLAQAQWARARRESRFELFRDALSETLRLTVEKADALGYRQHRYDALLDEFEPWTTTEEVGAVFGTLQAPLRSLAERIAASGRRPAAVEGRFPVPLQLRMSERILQDLGFDTNRGRLDVSAHPFTSTLGSSDIRLTTRFDEGSLTSGLLATIHECGHGLYEQGFDRRLEGTILAAAASLGFHESQARFWENRVGRSAAFWRRTCETARALFPGPLSAVSPEDLARAVNRVEPSLIRVEADEVTYSLHIILRFNLELRLVSGDLPVADLPGAWADESMRLLGIAPRRDAEGVLQDIHWAVGAIGYFPTYALGNLYAAQLAEAMSRELGDLDELIQGGHFGVMLKWLRSGVHAHGRVYPAGDLCRRATGAPLDPSVYLRYLGDKYAVLYGL